MTTLSLKEAALYLKIHPTTLKRRASRGTIPGAKIGHCWVFIEEDLKNYIRKKYPKPEASLRLRHGHKNITIDASQTNKKGNYEKMLGLE